MQFLEKVFYVNPDNVISAWFVGVMGILAATITALVTIPQLIYVYKNKKIENVNWISFWTFFFAITSWILLGSFLDNDGKGHKFVASVFANIVCSIIYSFVLFFMYRYSTDIKHQKKQYFILAITLTISITASILGMIGLYYPNGTKIGFTIPKLLGSFLLIIIPMATTFAFAPQVINDFQSKTFKTLAPSQLIALIITNITWLGYWFSLIVNSGIHEGLVATITWQIISLSQFTLQFIFTIRYIKNKAKETDNVQA
ncbi:PQ-loop domain-containing transporter [Mycoplasma sp. Mirounga ES2805-ORL]|uniref:PQ-loop domain-containing transporter n=1 Tax=Mycoplasma sp. Mirounga ES2805-ORL TaxID=754514 RepID=UPI00197B7871|nr:PQ-loop domain-containing transporter [Mycoplasma sp. Mirounga ES2805-ORL]QSF13512.1 hypothetical protein JXZ90_02440 [Mycoplasma sp. Mirounga ES2805-ORL]